MHRGRFRRRSPAVLAAATAATASAQLSASRPNSSLWSKPRREIGDDVRAAVQVTLPERFHVQSNEPRDRC